MIDSRLENFLHLFVSNLRTKLGSQYLFSPLPGARLPLKKSWLPAPGRHLKKKYWLRPLKKVRLLGAVFSCFTGSGSLKRGPAPRHCFIILKFWVLLKLEIYVFSLQTFIENWNIPLLLKRRKRIRYYIYF